MGTWHCWGHCYGGCDSSFQTRLFSVVELMADFMTDDFGQLLRGHIRAALAEPAFVDALAAVLELSRALTELRRRVWNAQWPGVRKASLAALGLGHSYTCLLNEVWRDWADDTEAVRAVGSACADAFGEISQRSDRVTIVANIRQRLTSGGANLSPHVESLLSLMAAGASAFPGMADPVLAASDPSPAAPVQLPSRLAVAASNLGLQGLAHHNFNKIFLSEEPLSTDVEPVLEAFSDLAQGCAERLISAQMRLHDAAAATTNRDQLVAAAQRLGSVAEDIVTPLAAAQARVVRLAADLRSSGRGVLAEKTGLALVGAATTMREAFASYASSGSLVLDLHRPQLAAETDSLLSSAATTIPFSAVLPNGANVELSELSTVEGGAFVEISGFAESFRQSRLPDGKLVSVVELRDPSSGATARAAAIFVHLPHTGVTEGAFICLSGIYRKRSVLFGGKPGVQIDALAPEELAAQSWQVQLYALAAPWFMVWRNWLNIQWSMGPHSAAHDSTKARRGAAEMIYTPFVRKTAQLGRQHD
jgi:hypothetical protein